MALVCAVGDVRAANADSGVAGAGGAGFFLKNENMGHFLVSAAFYETPLRRS
jgi:hypothetical protein